MTVQRNGRRKHHEAVTGGRFTVGDVGCTVFGSVVDLVSDSALFHRVKRSGVMCTHNARIYSSVSNKATVSPKARLRLFYKFVPPSINALPRI